MHEDFITVFSRIAMCLHQQIPHCMSDIALGALHENKQLFSLIFFLKESFLLED